MTTINHPGLRRDLHHTVILVRVNTSPLTDHLKGTYAFFANRKILDPVCIPLNFSLKTYLHFIKNSALHCQFKNRLLDPHPIVLHNFCYMGQPSWVCYIVSHNHVHFRSLHTLVALFSGQHLTVLPFSSIQRKFYISGPSLWRGLIPFCKMIGCFSDQCHRYRTRTPIFGCSDRTPS